MSFRDCLAYLEKKGKLLRVKREVDTRLDIAAGIRKISDTDGPALLFENIKGFPGWRIAGGIYATQKLIALAIGLPFDADEQRIVNRYLECDEKRIKPKLVTTGPVKEVIKGTIENLIVSAEEGRIRVLEYKEVIPPPRVSKLFSLDIHQNVFQLEMVFSIPKGPSRYSLIYFPPELGKRIMRYDLKESTDIILLVEKKLQTKIHHAHQTMGIQLADPKVSKYLSVRKKTPIFAMERHYLSRDGSPIFLSFNYCRPDLYKFKIELTRT